MQEYNNTDSYPDSVRAARIKLGLVDDLDCNYLYGRDVKATGKFCAGGNVDACQVKELLLREGNSFCSCYSGEIG